MRINIIAAIAKNGVIGGNNNLLWHYEEDLVYFKEHTINNSIIMGYNTYKSIPRQLKNRFHIILSKSETHNSIEDGVIVSSISQALEEARRRSENVYVIGGGQVYKQFIYLADRLYLTRIAKEFNGDTYFPEIPKGLFNLESIRSGENKDLTFEIWDRDINYYRLIKNQHYGI